MLKKAVWLLVVRKYSDFPHVGLYQHHACFPRYYCFFAERCFGPLRNVKKRGVKWGASNEARPNVSLKKMKQKMTRKVYRH